MFVTDFFGCWFLPAMIAKLNICNTPRDLSDSDLQPQLPQARSHKRAVHAQHQNSFSFSFFQCSIFLTS